MIISLYPPAVFEVYIVYDTIRSRTTYTSRRAQRENKLFRLVRDSNTPSYIRILIQFEDISRDE